MSVLLPDSFSHVMLFTHDVEASMGFYEKLLGFVPGYRSSHYGTMHHASVGVGLALHLAEPGSADIGHGPQLYFGVVDLDAAVAALRAAGLEVSDPKSEGGPRFSMFRDNAGNALGLQEVG